MKINSNKLFWFGFISFWFSRSVDAYTKEEKIIWMTTGAIAMIFSCCIEKEVK